jgi:predicted ribosome quality control (RQC) complex YloA/Tae2 family protein
MSIPFSRAGKGVETKKNSAVTNTALELKPLVAGARVEKIHQLDTHTYLFTLYGGGRSLLLLLSVARRYKAFHLLFQRVHGDYLTSLGPPELFKKRLAGGRVVGLSAIGEVVQVAVRREEEYRLTCDYPGADLLLHGEGNALLFSLKSAPRGGGAMPAGATSRSGPQRQGVVPGSDDERDTQSRLPLNEKASEAFFSFWSEHMRGLVLKKVRTEAKKIVRLIEKLEVEHDETREKDAILMKGELLKAHLPALKRTLPRGAERVLLNDGTGNSRTVELDPQLGPLENMNAFFKRYKKLRHREDHIGGNLSNQRERLQALGSFGEALAAAGLPDLRRGISEVVSLAEKSRLGKAFIGTLLSPSRRPSPRSKTAETKRGRGEGFLRFTSRSGKSILVGRDAKENDHLSTRVGRGNDLWFHASGGSGSHVILRYEKNEEFRESDIADAALLALHFSKLRKRGEGEVVYTYCKSLKKPKGSKEGTVLYHNNKTRQVRLEQELLGRLTGRSPV